jgi:3-deoxy-D-manno-octulosonate 8-phosphate phosphatase (KDO 8-P phosphatase)
MENNQQFAGIDTFLFDVDGVFTDNRLLVTEQGELLRTMNARDGYAVKRALEAGYHIAIITGGTSKGVEIRLRGLGISEIYSGVADKMKIMHKHLSANSINHLSCLYLGDDMIDIPCIEWAGIGVCPADAIEEVKIKANYICRQNGGDACVREVIELVMKSKGEW